MTGKIIKVENCQSCPYEGTCKAWKDLTAKQRIYLSISNNVPHEFMLEKCHLEDEGINNA